MPFLKIDTSGMNARYGRTKVAPEKSRQVTEFNTPSKNRAPDIPKTEAKEGDILSFFDDGKGKVLTSFDGGYQSSMTSKVSDMNRVDLGFDPISIEAGKGSRISFRGVIQAGLVGQNIITITSSNKTQYIPDGTKELYLDGSQGGEVGSFIRANTACEINTIIIDDHGGFDAAIVILESGGANWTFEMGTSSAQNNDLVMDSDDLFYAELSSNDMTITTGARAMFTRSSNDWKLHSLSSLDGIIMQTGTLQPIADDTYDLGASTKQWRNGYFDGTLEADVITVGGATLNSVIEGVTVTNATTAVNATRVVITDNESTNENNAIIFTAGGQLTGGTLALESDGDLYYNPNTSKLTADNMDIGNTLAVTSVVQAGAGGTDNASFSCGAIDLGMYRYTTNVLGFTCNDEDSYRMADTYFMPGTDDHSDLGGASNSFDDVYATNGTIQTSDSRLKESISDSALGLNFLNELRPVQFKFKDKTRRHYGLVAQEVEQVLSDSGISTTDFAPLIHDGDSDRYGMRYSEFTSILIKAIQELSKEVEELKKE